MAAYQLTATDIILRTIDGAFIPKDPANRDRIAYAAWLAGGGIPDPYVQPTPDSLSAVIDPVTLRVLFNHENRIRTLEARPTITAQQFLTALQTLLGG